MLGSDILTMCFNFFGKHQIITEKIAGFFLVLSPTKNVLMSLEKLELIVV
jgi:hypothetical protein